MLIGKSFRLELATLSVEDLDGNRTAVTLPAGAIVKVVSVPTSAADRMVDVCWEGRIVTVFLVDMHVRSTQITYETVRA